MQLSVPVVSAAFTSAFQQALITEPVCRFLELLQFGKLACALPIHFALNRR
jgi:hypothetical protein